MFNHFSKIAVPPYPSVVSVVGHPRRDVTAGIARFSYLDFDAPWFEGSVNAESYLEMLLTAIWPAVRNTASRKQYLLVSAGWCSRLLAMHLQLS